MLSQMITVVISIITSFLTYLLIKWVNDLTKEMRKMYKIRFWFWICRTGVNMELPMKSVFEYKKYGEVSDIIEAENNHRRSLIVGKNNKRKDNKYVTLGDRFQPRKFTKLWLINFAEKRSRKSLDYFTYWNRYRLVSEKMNITKFRYEVKERENERALELTKIYNSNKT